MRFQFSKPRIEGYDFSFSGLKTSILYSLEKWQKDEPDFISNNLNDLCASIQKTVIDILMHKLVKASKETGIKEIAVAGGVSANSGLRDRLKAEADNQHWKIHIPKFEYCTDNAAMIAITGRYMFEKGIFANQTVVPLARLPISR
jgi:N6-L-threonylcarbamoyladenine synthase